MSSSKKRKASSLKGRESIQNAEEDAKPTINDFNDAIPTAKKRRISLRNKGKSTQEAEKAEEVVNPGSNYPNAAFNRSDTETLMWKLTYYFTDEQVLLVNSFLNRKPRDIDMKDYLHQFKNAIQPAQPKGNLVVHSGEYWKQQFEDEYQRSKKLRNRIGLQKERIRTLEERLVKRPVIMTQRPSTADSDEDEIPSRSQFTTSVSHGDQSLDCSKETNHSMDTIPSGDDEMEISPLAYSNDYTNTLSYLYQVTELRRSLSDTDNKSMLQGESTPILCRKLIEFTREAMTNSILRYANVRESNLSTKDLRCLIYLTNEIVESQKNCIEISTEQYRTIAGRGAVIKSNIIYSLCSFFDTSLKQLEELCVSNTKLPLMGVPSKDEEFIMIRIIANLLIDILQRINWQPKNELHIQIFEGILSRILEKIGTLISHLIFREKVADSKAPGNISSEAASLGSDPRETNLQSKYLIPILNVALKVQKEKQMGGPTEALVTRARKKIRNTLVNCIIGGHLPGLKAPDEPGEVDRLDVPELLDLERFGPEWTIQFVFAMVGMDVGDGDGDGDVGGDRDVGVDAHEEDNVRRSQSGFLW
ncbi:hypothetical protein NHQ30_009532 [Ciborinia camelliae]|nr:hypothetical protein NHQ30_009532 [Ciborinia camelliae]